MPEEAFINGRLVLRSNQLGHDALERLQRMRQTGALIDVVIKIPLGRGDDDDDDEFFLSIPCHKLLLCLCSPYFEAMFAGTGAFAEADKAEVIMEGEA